jgi:hypothetical protein
MDKFTRVFWLVEDTYRRFLLYLRKGILIRLFKSLAQNSDTEFEFIDGSYAKVHQQSTGAYAEHEKAITLSRRGGQHQ